MSFIKKLTSALVASSLMLGLVGTAFAAPSADDVTNAYNRLNAYSIVQGKAGPTGEVTPALADPITRAELLAILVRAWGQESNAKLLKGATTGFADVDGVAGVEWTTGYVFIGSRIADTNGGQKLGTGSGFNPSGKLTAAETLAFVMKFLGLNAGTGANWVADTIAAAKTAGLITDADEAKYLANPTAAVNRGEAFAMLDNMFASYNKLEGGKTIYTTFIDNKAPELTVNKPELTTDKTAVTVTGQVKDYTTLYLGSEAVTANADGTFSVEVKLAMGKNDIAISAIDRVGNSSEETFTVTRNPGKADKIVATVSSANVVAGAVVDVAVKVLDVNGQELEVVAADIKGTIGGSVGTYADGKFTAAEKVGTGTLSISYGDLTPATIDLTVVAGPLAKVNADKTSVEKGGLIKLSPTDKFGNAIASGVTYTWAPANEKSKETGIAVTSGGVVYTAEAGSYTITAKAGDATAPITVGVYSITVASLSVKTSESVVANGVTLAKVDIAAVDEFGNTVGTFATAINLSGTGVTYYNKAADGSVITSVTPEKGVATVYAAVANYMAGEQVTLNAVHSTDATIKGSAKLAGLTPVATTLKATAPKYLAANAVNTAAITVKVVDQAGVAINGVYTVTADITGPAKISTAKTATYYKAEGGAASQASFTITNAESIGTEGPITLTFNVEGVGSTTATVSHLIAGNPYKLGVTAEKDTMAANAGAKIKFSVELQDRNGVPVAATGSPDLTVIMPDAYEGKFAVSTDGNFANKLTPNATTGNWTVSLANGKTADFYVHVNGKYTGDVAVSVEATANTVKVAGSKTVSVTIGDVKNVALDRTGETVNAPVAAPKATFVASLTDNFSNTVAAADVELAVYAVEHGTASATNVTVNGKNATASDVLKIKTDAAGKATLNLEARPYTNKTYDVVVSYTKDAVTTTDTVALHIDNTVVASLSSKVVKKVTGTNTFIQPNSITAGEEYYVVVSAKDNYGGPAIGFASALKLTFADNVVGKNTTGDVYAKGDTRPAFLPHNDASVPTGLTLNAGDYFVKLVGGKAGVVSLGVAYEALQTSVTTSSNASVIAGAVNKIIANGAEQIKVKGTSKVHGPYTLSLVDKFNNVVTQNANATITVAEHANDNRITVRAEAGGVTVTELTTRSTTNFYFVATATATFTLDFSASIDADANGTPESYTGTATVVVEAE